MYPHLLRTVPYRLAKMLPKNKHPTAPWSHHFKKLQRIYLHATQLPRPHPPIKYHFLDNLFKFLDLKDCIIEIALKSLEKEIQSKNHKIPFYFVEDQCLKNYRTSTKIIEIKNTGGMYFD